MGMLLWIGWTCPSGLNREVHDLLIGWHGLLIEVHGLLIGWPLNSGYGVITLG